MNLTSCEECGMVLDKRYLFKRKTVKCYDDGSVNMDSAGWSDSADDFVRKVSCPCCKSEILDE